MYYTIYKITNKINGKIYIGKHQTKNIYDSYMGSGYHLNKAKQKHGIENFEKEILFVFMNEDEMNAKEKELVTEEFCLRKDTYNLAVGGQGGFSYLENGKMVYPLDKPGVRQKGRKAADVVITEKFGSMENFYKYVSFKSNQKYKQKYKQKYENDIDFRRVVNENQKNMTLKAASKTSNDKRKKTMQANGHGKCEKNSQFGTMWITDGFENKKTKKENSIPNGWKKGRILKNNKVLNYIE